MKKFLIVSFAIILSCQNPFYNEITIEEELNQRGFLYKTTQTVRVEIDTLYSFVPVEIYYNDKKSSTLISDDRGTIFEDIILPSYISKVTIKTDYIGLINSVDLEIANRKIDFSFSNQLPNSNSRGFWDNFFNNSQNYNTLGNWNDLGVPEYLLDREVLTEDFLNVLNSILPERQPVPEYNPQYLENSAITDIHITQEAEVFVTFIHEGAGYKNSLGFFTYQTANGPPNSLSSTDITIIFPNVSYTNSGGGLTSGDRVRLGTFLGGTSIGWALVADGYSSTSNSVGSGRNKFYSVDELNPEDSEYNQHVVQVDFEERVVFAFEDLLRPDGDNDFNDALFSVSSNPITAIDRSNIVKPEESPTIDSDGDGVIDSLDFAPNNSSVSSVNHYPAQGESGAIAYEDLWPYMGDYDFNDLVIDLNIVEELDSQGYINSVIGKFQVKGIVASMRNGFAIELGVDSSMVESVTGGEFSRGYIQRNSSGVEERQNLAVIGIFEDANLHFDSGNEIEVTILFSDPVSRSELGYPPYNPFVISNGERGREVHLPGMKATDLAHQGYFQTEDDNSTFVNGNSYTTSDNSPWAIHVPADFSYPKDDKRIDRVYNYFNNWVESEGVEFPDWYLQLEGYVNSELLFGN